jgi:hypothetical protein
MSRALTPPALSAIADIALKSVKGQEVAAKELWAQAPVLIYVMRRPGCSEAPLAVRRSPCAARPCPDLIVSGSAASAAARPRHQPCCRPLAAQSCAATRRSRCGAHTRSWRSWACGWCAWCTSGSSARWGVQPGGWWHWPLRPRHGAVPPPAGRLLQRPGRPGPARTAPPHLTSAHALAAPLLQIDAFYPEYWGGELYHDAAKGFYQVGCRRGALPLWGVCLCECRG